mmetsp:Transcript_87504/g.139032  ORF Transcript_87504/g.139032 Transcript_87504/m.139032 type:complete len:84 (-) Transcript_87504:743-994(-)
MLWKGDLGRATRSLTGSTDTCLLGEHELGRFQAVEHVYEYDSDATGLKDIPGDIVGRKDIPGDIGVLKDVAGDIVGDAGYAVE